MISFNKARTQILSDAIELSTDVLKAMLVTVVYVPDKADISISAGAAAAELSGTGYAAGFAGSGRKTLTSIAVTQDDANDWAKWTAGNLTWTGINAGTAAAVVVYKHITSDSASVPIVHIDGGFGPTSTNGGDLPLNWGSNGIFTFS